MAVEYIVSNRLIIISFMKIKINDFIGINTEPFHTHLPVYILKDKQKKCRFEVAVVVGCILFFFVKEYNSVRKSSTNVNLSC